jgi:hypothetical protein
MHLSSYCLPQRACECPLRTRTSMKELIQRLSVAAVGRNKTCQNSLLILTAIRQFSQKYNPFGTKINLHPTSQRKKCASIRHTNQ